MSSRRERARRENGENSTEESGLLGARQVIRNMAMKGPRQVILGGIRIPPWCRAARHGDPRAAVGGHPPRERRLGLNKRSEEPLAGSAWDCARRAPGDG